MRLSPGFFFFLDQEHGAIYFRGTMEQKQNWKEQERKAILGNTVTDIHPQGEPQNYSTLKFSVRCKKDQDLS